MVVGLVEVGNDVLTRGFGGAGWVVASWEVEDEGVVDRGVVIFEIELVVLERGDSSV